MLTGTLACVLFPCRTGPLADQTVNTIESARLYNDLQRAGARIRRLVNSSIIGIFSGNSRGRIIEAKDAFLEMQAMQ
jgi:PAS domain-containing protein